MIEEINKVGEVTICKLKGTLEVSKQAKFKEELTKQTTPPCRLVLNFKGVDFIDSACLGALISVARMVREKGGDVKLAGMNREVASVFQITRLDKVFSIFDKPEEAVNAFAS